MLRKAEKNGGRTWTEGFSITHAFKITVKFCVGLMWTFRRRRKCNRLFKPIPKNNFKISFF